jgi:phage host-nuclease inhibitor protein Gam
MKKLDEIDPALARLGKIRVEVSRVEALYDLKVQALKAKLSETTHEKVQEIEKIENGIKMYVLDNINDFRTEKKKSRDFQNGTISTKTGEAITYPPDNVLSKRLKENGHSALIDTKEVPMKASVKKLPDKMLKILGVVKDEPITVTIKTVSASD